MRSSSEARGSSILKSMPPEEVQVKRSRGELSCAECRRCRIRCDRKVPCGSCVRRGCVSLCPNGSLRAGHGSRFVLADTEELHGQISQMSQRIRQLEDALSTAHSSDTHGDRHPLLREELLAVKFGSGPRDITEDHEDRFALSFGTLAVTDSGGSSYFGVSAGALAKPFAEQALSSGSTSRSTLPPHDVWNHSSRGQSKLPEEVIADLRRALPSHSQAVHLCEQYSKKYRFQPIQIGDLMDEILPFVYEGDLMRSPHKAAVLYFVFATGSLMDLNLPPHNPQAQAFCELGLKALDLRNISTSSELETVIAISLLASYHGDLGTENCLETAWEEMSLAIKVAQKIGLHREPSRWNLEPSQVRQRRRLFWELMFQDGVRSLSLGRPPTMSLKWVDCDLPAPEERTPEQILASFQYSMTKEVIWPLMELMESTSPSSYGAVLELDKKLRELRAATNVYEEQFNATAATLEWNCILSANVRQAALLCLHRPFLAMALLQHPENPFESMYSQSVLAAQNSASFIIHTAARYLEKAPESISRYWDVWSHISSAAITAASIAIHAPNVASNARSDLDLAIRILERGGDYSWYARVALPYVRQLVQRANNPTPSAELSNSPMLGGPSGTESEESGSGDGNKNRDDLYLFTRGQVFKKSGRRSSVPLGSFSFPATSSGVLKLPPPPPFTAYSDSGFDNPCLPLLSFPVQQDGYSSYSSHGGNHGYHSTSSTPGMPASLVPSLELYPLENVDHLSMFGAAANATTTGVDGGGHTSSASWLQHFGIPEGPSIGFGR